MQEVKHETAVTWVGVIQECKQQGHVLEPGDDVTLRRLGFYDRTEGQYHFIRLTDVMMTAKKLSKEDLALIQSPEGRASLLTSKGV